MARIITFQALGRYGRFCNQMYQIAGTIGIARRNGFDFAFPYWKNYDHADRFASPEDIDCQSHFVNPLPIYDGPPLPDRFIDWGYHDIQLTQNVSLSGHMQSFRYFEHCFDEVKHYFEMRNQEPLNDYCAVHVRLGDYDDAYHPRLNENYYVPAMRRFAESQPFLIFSDDIPAARAMFGEGVEYSEGRNYIEDFRLMRSCRHFIIGNSTFSSMAAVLGEAPNKKVIAPRPWFGKGYATIDGEDIYNSDWEVITYQ